MTAAPQLIDIGLIDDHPHNPRPTITVESVSDLVEIMGDTYSASHAIRVRKISGRYQIIGGHRRKAAARTKGHTHIWCNVEKIDNDDAFMELVRDNTQKELDPIYIGIHAYLACDVAKKGKGLNGGIAEYARQIGRDRSSVSRLRAAGEVAKKTCRKTRIPDGVSRQLYEISRLPEPCWQEACDWLLGLTADQRQESIGTIRDVASRVSCAMSLDLPESIMGTSKELTARLDAFHGRPTEWTAKTIEPTAEIQPAIADVEPITEDDNDVVETVITASEPTVIERASQSRSRSLAASDDLVHAFSDRTTVVASRELQQSETPTTESSTDDDDWDEWEDDETLATELESAWEEISCLKIADQTKVILHAIAQMEWDDQYTVMKQLLQGSERMLCEGFISIAKHFEGDTWIHRWSEADEKTKKQMAEERSKSQLTVGALEWSWMATWSEFAPYMPEKSPTTVMFGDPVPAAACNTN